eukprot:scaffold241911_cov39-Prasinocladus_malaysianus.AAC.1
MGAGVAGQGPVDVEHAFAGLADGHGDVVPALAAILPRAVDVTDLAVVVAEIAQRLVTGDVMEVQGIADLYAVVATGKGAAVVASRPEVHDGLVGVRVVARRPDPGRHGQPTGGTDEISVFAKGQHLGGQLVGLHDLGPGELCDGVVDLDLYAADVGGQQLLVEIVTRDNCVDVVALEANGVDAFLRLRWCQAPLLQERVAAAAVLPAAARRKVDLVVRIGEFARVWV